MVGAPPPARPPPGNDASIAYNCSFDYIEIHKSNKTLPLYEDADNPIGLFSEMNATRVWADQGWARSVQVGSVGQQKTYEVQIRDLESFQIGQTTYLAVAKLCNRGIPELDLPDSLCQTEIY